VQVTDRGCRRAFPRAGGGGQTPFSGGGTKKQASHHPAGVGGGGVKHDYTTVARARVMHTPQRADPLATT